MSIATQNFGSILKLLKSDLFNDRMSGIKLLDAVLHADPLEVGRVIRWMEEQQVFDLLLRENLHQPQYVERVERIVCLLVELGHFTTAHLDRIWEAQSDKHEAIVNNVFILLSGLSLKFDKEEWNHLLVLLRRSLGQVNSRQRDRLLGLACQLAKLNNNSFAAPTLSEMLWGLAIESLAQSSPLPFPSAVGAPTSPSSSSLSGLRSDTEALLAAQVTVMGTSIAELKERNCAFWLQKLAGLLQIRPVQPLGMAVPLLAVIQFTRICNLLPPVTCEFTSRVNEIQKLTANCNLLGIAVQNLVTYRSQKWLEHTEYQSSVDISLHFGVTQLLDFIRYLLLEGRMVLPLSLMEKIWASFISQTDPASTSAGEQLTGLEQGDRDICFKWFGALPLELIGRGDLQTLFTNQVLSIDPVQCTASGLTLVQHYFNRVNNLDVRSSTVMLKAGRRVVVGVARAATADGNKADEDETGLYGLEFFWRLLLFTRCPAICDQAVDFLQNLCRSSSPGLTDHLIDLCLLRLRQDFATVSHVISNGTASPTKRPSLTPTETVTLDRMVRVIRLLQNFMAIRNHSDDLVYDHRRSTEMRLPLGRASVGTPILLVAKCYFPKQLFSKTEGKEKTSPTSLTVPINSNMSIVELRHFLIITLLGFIKPGRRDVASMAGQFILDIAQAAEITEALDFEKPLPSPSKRSSDSSTHMQLIPTDRDSDLVASLLSPTDQLSPWRSADLCAGDCPGQLCVLSITAALTPTDVNQLFSQPRGGSVQPPQGWLRYAPSPPTYRLSPSPPDTIPYGSELDDLDRRATKLVYSRPLASPTVDSPEVEVPYSRSSSADSFVCNRPESPCLEPLTDGEYEQPEEEEEEQPTDSFVYLDAVSRGEGEEETDSDAGDDDPCRFLLQLTSLALALDNLPLCSKVFSVLLSFPAADSLVHKLEFYIGGTSAVALTKCQAQLTPSEAEAAHRTDLVRLFQPDDAGRFSLFPFCDPEVHRTVQRVYALQVLYSLCMPAHLVCDIVSQAQAAWVDGADPTAARGTFSPDSSTGGRGGDGFVWRLGLSLPAELPVHWKKAAQHTLDLLRSGACRVLVTLLSGASSDGCPGQQKHSSSDPASPSTVLTHLNGLVEFWALRLCRLLYTVSAHLVRSAAGAGGVRCDDELSCVSLRLSGLLSDPDQEPRDDVFLLLAAETVARLVTPTEVIGPSEVFNDWLQQSDGQTIFSPLLGVLQRSATAALQSPPGRPNSTDTDSEGGNFPALGKAQSTPLAQAINDTSAEVTLECLRLFPLTLALFPRDHLSRDAKQFCGWSIDRLLLSPVAVFRQAAEAMIYQSVTFERRSAELVEEAPGEGTPSEIPRSPVADLLGNTINRLFSLFRPRDIVEGHDGEEEQEAVCLFQAFALCNRLIRYARRNSILVDEAHVLLASEMDLLDRMIKERIRRCNSSTEVIEAAQPGTVSQKAQLGEVSPRQPRARLSSQLITHHLQLCASLYAYCRCVSEDGLDHRQRSQTKAVVQLAKDTLRYLVDPLNHDNQGDNIPVNGNVTTSLTDSLSSATCQDPFLASCYELVLTVAQGNRSDSELLKDLCTLLINRFFKAPSEEHFTGRKSWTFNPSEVEMSRSPSSFSMEESTRVGLVNGGATCYMNCILQQMFALIPLRKAVLSAKPSQRLLDAQQSITAPSTPADVPSSHPPATVDQHEATLKTPPPSPSDDVETVAVAAQPEAKPISAKQTHYLRVLTQTQELFGHLCYSHLGAYQPEGFWREFRLASENFNLGEQQDAVEFFHVFGDKLDEALQLCGSRKAVEEVLGGTFADQKLCIDCSHEYTRHESFTSLSLDIRGHLDLEQSLEQYVKGDLLEGCNAYYCEVCDKKVATLKRMCIDKLPRVLVIQLKRFDFDWDRNVPVKFNDYFEFPQTLDMYPYTVEGLGHQKSQDSGSNPDSQPNGDSDKSETPARQGHTKYTLRGVVVHSGQASGGHYYSFVRHYCAKKRQYQWYKYDDRQVCPCNVDHPEDARREWFGGDLSSDSRHQYLSAREQWWSAYLLFYERDDFTDYVRNTYASVQESSEAVSRMKQIIRENQNCLYERVQYHPLTTHFVSRLADLSIEQCLTQPGCTSDLGPSVTSLVLNYCFTVRFQNVAFDWCRWIPKFVQLVNLDSTIRQLIVSSAFLSSVDRVAELLFECPYAEVRFLFCYLIFCIACATSDVDSGREHEVHGAKCVQELRQLIGGPLVLYGSSSGSTTANTITARYRRHSAGLFLVSQRCLCGGQSASWPTMPSATPAALSPVVISINRGYASPSLAEFLLQLVMHQVAWSPQHMSQKSTGPGYGGYTAYSKDYSYPNGIYAGAGDIITADDTTFPGSSYTRCRAYWTDYSLVWTQYLAIFLDYARLGVRQRNWLIRSQLPELLLLHVMKQFRFTNLMAPPLRTNREKASLQSLERLKTTLAKVQHNGSLTDCRSNWAAVTLSLSATRSTAKEPGVPAPEVSLKTAVYAGPLACFRLLSLLVRSTNTVVSEDHRIQLVYNCTASEVPNPYAMRDSEADPPPTGVSASQPPMSSVLYRLLLPSTSDQFTRTYLYRWFNEITKEPITEILQFLSFNNFAFSKTALDAVIQLLKRGMGEVDTAFQLLRALISVQDEHRLNRVRHAFLMADNGGLVGIYQLNVSETMLLYHIKLVVSLFDVAALDSDILTVLRENHTCRDWLRRWVEGIVDYLRTSSPLQRVQWRRSPPQFLQDRATQDLFMSNVEAVHRLVPFMRVETEEPDPRPSKEPEDGGKTSSGDRPSDAVSAPPAQQQQST